MLRKLAIKTSIWVMALVCFASAGDLWAIAQNFRNRNQYYKPQARNPVSPYRFGFIPAPTNILPGTAKQEKKCIPHGQARCIGHKKQDRFTANRYVNRSMEANSVHPRFRAHNPSKYAPKYE